MKKLLLIALIFGAPALPQRDSFAKLEAIVQGYSEALRAYVRTIKQQ